MQGEPKDERHNSNANPITSEHDRDDVNPDGGQNVQSAQYQSIIQDLNTVTEFTQEWFKLKEQELSLRNKNGMELDLIDGDGVPPVPVAMTTDPEETLKKEVTCAIRGVETIDDNHIPVPLSAQMSTLEKSDIKPAENTRLTLLSDSESPEIPTSFDQSLIDKQEQEASNTQTGDGNLSDDESIAYPRRDNDPLRATTSTVDTEPFSNVINGGDPETAPSAPAENNRNIEMAVNTAELLVNNTDGESHEGLDDSIEKIAEAYLVDDENVFVATPAEPQIPWWKQRRTKFLFGFVFLLFVTVLVVSITVPRSQTITKLVAVTSPPTFSLSPSSWPSFAPSLSAMPSSAPSACSVKIINNIRKIDLLQDNPTGLKAALDGKNLVLAWQQFAGSIQVEGSFYTAFYSLSDNGEWESAGYFIEGNLVWESFDADFDVAISGRTAVIGMPTNNEAYVYMQNTAGLWEKTPSLQPNNQVSDCGGFGVSVYICDNLVVVRDASFCSTPARSYYAVVPHADYFFEQSGGEWKEIGMNDIDADYYLYDYFEEDENAEETIPDILTKYHMKYPVCLETNSSYFALNEDSGISIYQKEENNTIPMFVQSLNGSLYGDGFGKTFAMSQGVLIVGSDNQTHFFSRESADQWDEILTLDQSYDSYELSGRTLIATHKGEVYSIDIADCTPQIPTSAQSMPVDDIDCYPVNITSSFKYLYDYLYDYDDDVERLCYPFNAGGSWEVIIQTDEFLESDSIIVQTLADDDSCGYTDLTTCLYPGWYKVNFLTNWLFHCYNLTLNFDGASSSEQDFTFSGCNDLGFKRETALFDIPRTTLIMETPAPQTPYPTLSWTITDETPYPTASWTTTDSPAPQTPSQTPSQTKVAPSPPPTN